MPFLEPYWNFLLVHPLLSLLVAAYDLLFSDFGLAVIAVTVLIRVALYPLYLTQLRSQRAMQEIAPAMKQLQAKHGKDRQRLSEEQMKLYREHGVNPAMGCLPLLLQMPLLFAMYAAFQQAPLLTGDQLRAALWPFVNVPVTGAEHLDLTAHWLPWITGCVQDGVTLSGLGCPDPLKILPILAGATQLIASLMAQARVAPADQDQQAKTMQMMAYYFPLITVFIATGLPSGLAVYWVSATLVQIVQQYFVSGWGQLPRFLPFLRGIPTPADRVMATEQRAIAVEAEADLSAPVTDDNDGRSRRRRRRGR